MDASEGVDPQGSGKRSISFILYLNEPGWRQSDGGALRIHRSGGQEDFLPESGSLVLFDSKLVEHEVMPTRRERACIVGWFHAE